MHTLVNRRRIRLRIALSSVFSWACLAGFGASDSVAADVAGLLKFVPRSSNAVLLMDAAAVKKSKVAVQNGWSAKHKAAAAERPLFLPPEADAIVIASQVDPTNSFQQDWELAVVALQKPMSMPAIAKAEGGYPERVGGFDAVWTPSDAYFVGLEPKTLGVMYPANRQAVSRWAKTHGKSPAVEASAYLVNAARQLSDTTPIVLALDLKDFAPPHVIQQAVMETTAIDAKPEKRKEIARLFSGIEGITLVLSLDADVRGSFHFDFGESTAPLGAYARPLLVEMLDRMDLAIPELDKFTVDLKGNSAMFGGRVPTMSLRRLFSLLEIPTTKFSSVEEPTTQVSEADLVATASLEYFQAVRTLIDDLRSTLEKARDNHAVYSERYARKVDRLPILNVDEDLLTWGASVGETFRAMALAQRSAGIRSGARKSAVYGNYWYTYDNNGYYSSRSTESVRNQIRSEERATANTFRFNRWKELEDSIPEIRKKMTLKYKKEF